MRERLVVDDPRCGAVVEILPAPKLHARAPVLVAIPALGVPAGWYRALASSVVERGLRLVTIELRGRGQSPKRAGPGVDWGMLDVVHEDLVPALAAVRARFPGAKVVLLGHSAGGQLGAVLQALAPRSGDVLVTVATGSVLWWLFPWRYRFMVLLGTQFTRIVSMFLGYYPGDKVGFGGHEAKTVMAEWASEAWSGRLRLVGEAQSTEDLLGQTPTPTLMVSLPGDTFYAPPRAVEALASKLPRGPTEVLHLADEELAGMDRLHFNWVLDGGRVLDAILPWLERNLR